MPKRAGTRDSLETREVYPAGAGTSRRNLLVEGDNRTAARALLPNLAGRVDLLYLDPPFATGSAFVCRLPVGDRGEAEVEMPAYPDRWAGLPAYLEMMAERLSLARDLLSPQGNLFLHCDHRAAPYLAVLCDELFGPGDRSSRRHAPGFRNEIVWSYGLGGSTPRCYPKKHDTILWYTKGDAWRFTPPRVPATSYRMRGRSKKCPDTWEIPAINNMARERTGYPTQKPEALLERIVRAHSREGALVGDLFCGSGTFPVVAGRLGRRWIACDRSALAIHVTRKRLLEEKARETFAVLAACPSPLPPWGALSLRAAWKNGGVRLTGLEYEHPDAIPRAARCLVRSWSDWIDLWAVNGAGRRGPLISRWVAFRSRDRRFLPLVSARLPAGPRRFRLFAVDLFGGVGQVTLER